MRKSDIQLLDLQFVMQVLAQLECSLADVPKPGVVRLKVLGIVMADHRGARSRGTDDGVIAIEQLDQTPGNRGGIIVAARVGHRLTTAGLAGWVSHIDAKPF